MYFKLFINYYLSYLLFLFIFSIGKMITGNKTAYFTLNSISLIIALGGYRKEEQSTDDVFIHWLIDAAHKGIVCLVGPKTRSQGHVAIETRRANLLLEV